MRPLLLASIGVILVTWSPCAQAQTRGHGTILGAIEGGALGAYAGTTLGQLGRGWCHDKTKTCNAPIAAGFLLGTALGVYAGASDTARVRGAAIGLGVGALTGIAVSTLIILGRSHDPQARAASIRDLVRGLAIGAAVGSVVGGLITHTPKVTNFANGSVTILHLAF
jgi:hypothetical protein